MKLLRFPRRFGARLILACALAAFAAPAFAEDAKDLERLFAPLTSGGCVTIADVRAAGALVELTPDQFQFVRAFWMAIPPVSQQLAPGDKAFFVQDATGHAAFGLFDESGAVCSVFEATDWIKKLVDQIGRGENGKRGDPT
jgi:hypothetical protein